MKKIIIGLFALSFIFISVGGYFYMEQNQKPKEKEQEQKQKKITGDIDFTEKETTLSDTTTKKMISLLSTWGEKIYNDKKYETYPKKNNMYFISLNQLKTDFQYDISNFKGSTGLSCNTDYSGIYFDIEGVMANYNIDSHVPILTSLIGCE